MVLFAWRGWRGKFLETFLEEVVAAPLGGLGADLGKEEGERKREGKERGEGAEENESE